jgi:TrmH family RNA methyltransferase
MGAALSLDLREAEPVNLELLSSAGVAVYAAALEEFALVAGRDTERGPCALVLGNEHDGIPEAWRRRCSVSVMVPVSDRVDSLNVAIAGSILMCALGYESAISRRT